MHITSSVLLVALIVIPQRIGRDLVVGGRNLIIMGYPLNLLLQLK